MDAYRIEDCIAQASIGMTRGKPVRVDDGRGIEVSVAYGSIWITQEYDRTDVCLGAGKTFRIDRDGATMIDALEPSLVTLTPSAPRAGALRVSMVAAGASPVELFDAGASRKPGRFDDWLERFWVRLFVPSARPTTAAL
jgi:hypothetical protein